MYKITNWENDMLNSPEEIVINFSAEKYPNYQLELLSGLKHRDIQDIYKSMKESRVILIQPSLLDPNQVAFIVSNISDPIHVNFNGAKREWALREIVCLSVRPFDDLQLIKEICPADSLSKIVKNVEVHFYGFDGEHYELKNGSYMSSDIYAIRHA